MAPKIPRATGNAPRRWLCHLLEIPAESPLVTPAGVIPLRMKQIFLSLPDSVRVTFFELESFVKEKGRKPAGFRSHYMPCAGGAKGGLRGRPPLDVPPPEEGEEAIWTPPPLPLDSIPSPCEMRCGSLVFWCSYCPSRTGIRRATDPFGRKTTFSSLTRIRRCRLDVSQNEH